MQAILLQTLPFFALIGLGYGAGRSGFFGAEATAALTKFVFYFALSAMLVRFAADLPLGEIFNAAFVAAYLAGSLAVYVLATVVAMWRQISVAEAAVEAQCAVIGNVGFLGIPMLVLLLGPAAVGPVLLVLAVDLIVFGSLIVILITGSRDTLRPGILLTVGKGLLANPMIVSIAVGLGISAAGISLPGPIDSFLETLGAAATPGALFAIGASLASKSAERLSVATWLTTAKLVLHPLAVAVMALWVFDIAPYSAGVMIAAAALPVAGNVYMVAQHYGVAAARASAAILVSHVLSILTVTLAIAWVTTL